MQHFTHLKMPVTKALRKVESLQEKKNIEGVNEEQNFANIDRYSIEVRT